MRPKFLSVLATALLALAVSGLPASAQEPQRGAIGSAEPAVSSGIDGTSREDNIAELREAAEAGDPLAQNNLGYAHTFGRGVHMVSPLRNTT